MITTTMATTPMTYYFAFGSNMRVSQMSARCPHSRYEGTARLQGWRWQINERGVANIESANSVVEGLVYSVDPSDVQKLDRYEGVGSGFYARKTVLLDLTRNEHSIETEMLASDLAGFCSRNVRIGVFQQEALAYVSDMRTDGPVRREYVERMEHAVHDAQALGVDRSYLETDVLPIVRGPILESLHGKERAQKEGARLTQPNGQGPATASAHTSEPKASAPKDMERYKNDLQYAMQYDANKRKRHRTEAKGSPTESPESAAPQSSAAGTLRVVNDT